MPSHSAPAHQVERQLVAILAADVAGYSRLVGANEEGTLAQLRACRQELIEPCIAAHHGGIVKTTGDGMLVRFASPVEATRCAVEIQQGMTERNADVPDQQRLQFRIGINLGDVIVENGDIFGDGVNVAARLEALAEPGGICISRSVRDQVRDSVSFAFEDLGEQRVKNIARPLHVYRLGNNTSAQTSLEPSPPAGSSLALPDKPSKGRIASRRKASMPTICICVHSGNFTCTPGKARATLSICSSERLRLIRRTPRLLH